MRSTCRLAPALALALLGACEAPLSPTRDGGAALARGTTTARYQLRFVAGTNEGEIVSSAPFPAGGVVLNEKDPWKNLTVPAAVLTLVSPTHGDPAALTCSGFGDTPVTWTIGTTPLTFAGDWTGELVVWSGRGGQNLRFRGTAEGGRTIDNVATNNNVVQRSGSSDSGQFTITFTNARMGFGSPSSPDGDITLAALPGYEAACANFTIVATRIN